MIFRTYLLKLKCPASWKTFYLIGLQTRRNIERKMISSLIYQSNQFCLALRFFYNSNLLTICSNSDDSINHVSIFCLSGKFLVLTQHVESVNSGFSSLINFCQDKYQHALHSQVYMLLTYFAIFSNLL